LTDSRDLKHFPYRRDRLIVVMRPDHPLATRTELSFDDTLDFDHVGLHVESSIYLSTRQAARLAGRPLKLRIHVPGFDSVCRMVQANMGIGIIPDRAFAILGPALNLHALRLTDDWAARLLKIIVRDERSLSPVSRLLLTICLCTRPTVVRVSRTTLVERRFAILELRQLIRRRP